MFERLWVAAPASTASSDGLGPLFNARTCALCHPGGGGATPDSAGFVMRLGHRDTGAADPTYGAQIQPQALPGHRAEAALDEVALDGSARLTGLAYGPLDAATAISPRLAPDLHNSGWIADIPDDWITAQADPLDANGDGVSGRVHRLPGGAIGRFGYKATQPDLPHQIAVAFHRDMGLSSTLFPEGYGDCTEQQPHCRTAPDGSAPYGVEIAPAVIEMIDIYLRSLAKPPRADRAQADGSQNARGAALFADLGCKTCHAAGPGDRPIYSDLLLHDMGPGLADDLPEGDASGREWRTAPLAGLNRRIGEMTYLLHDGRADSIMDAILWHGGEAASARDAALGLPQTDLDALLTYLESL